MHETSLPQVLHSKLIEIYQVILYGLFRLFQEENFRKREEDLKKRDLDLQETLLKFTKFLQDNDAKRAKANKRAQDEIKLREEKEREIDSLLVERMQLENEKNEVDSKLQQIIKWVYLSRALLRSRLLLCTPCMRL